MRTATWAVLLVVPAAAAGCVERKLVIRTDPPGATVFLEDELVPGKTPVEVPYTWDGVRHVTIQAPGHRVLETKAEVDARWYDWFPLDVFAELLYPGTIRDVRDFSFQLEPYYPLDKRPTDAQMTTLRERLGDLAERADDYRAGGAEGPKVERPKPVAAPAKPEDPPPPPAPRNPK